MKTILYSGCYLEGEDPLKNNRIERNIRYINYYHYIKDYIGFDNIFLLDNGSSYYSVKQFFERIDLNKFQFETLENLPFTGPNMYPYCWRALYYIENFIKDGYEKIICIDSDGFVLSKKMADYIKRINSGWTSFWCPRHEFPESSIHILCKDSFHLFYNYIKVPYEKRMGIIMEMTLPFTHIEDGFKCDRFGETETEMTDDIDYYGQAGPLIEPRLL